MTALTRVLTVVLLVAYTLLAVEVLAVLTLFLARHLYLGLAS